MSEVGFDISSATRKFADERLVQEADLVVSFKPKDELPDYLAQHDNIRFWEVADPQHQPIEFHRDVRDDVKKRVTSLVEELNV